MAVVRGPGGIVRHEDGRVPEVPRRGVLDCAIRAIQGMFGRREPVCRETGDHPAWEHVQHLLGREVDSLSSMEFTALQLYLRVNRTFHGLPEKE